MSNIHDTIETLTKERENQGLSLTELAKRSEVSRASISDWERFEAEPNLQNIVAWAWGLGFDLHLSLKDRDD